MVQDRRPILVPLDGSALAETALPWAVVLATRWRAPLVLARVVALRSHAAVSLADAALAAGAYEYEEQEARAYLERSASALRAAHPDVEVRGEVVCGDAAGALLDLEQQVDARVVVLTTHGRTGLARWARGSVAETIVRYGAAPVLLVRPWDRDETAAHLDGMAREGLRVLVPLDGSPLAQGVLPLVSDLAAGARGELILAGVVRPPDEHAIGPYYHPHFQDDRRALREYLSHRRADAEQAGIRARSAVGVESDVATALIDLASIESADVIALSTHGRGAIGRLLYGSIADRVAHAARVPVLLYRPHAEHGRQTSRTETSAEKTERLSERAAA